MKVEVYEVELLLLSYVILLGIYLIYFIIYKVTQ